MPKKHNSNSRTNPFAVVNLEAIREKEKRKAERIQKKKQKELEAKLKSFKKKHKPINNKKAYKITFKDQPNLLYVAFKPNRAKAMWDACKYFRDSLHLDFQKERSYSAEMKQARAIRVPELDEYGEEGQVPIPVLMKVLDIKFSCSHCHKEVFSYKDYEAGRCFIIEGEGDTNDFTKGRILCYYCHKKIIKNSN